MIEAAERPILYLGGGVVAAGARKGSGRARRAVVAADRDDADGPRLHAGRPSARARHARDARRAVHEPRARRMRFADRGRRAIRRPRDGQARRVLPARERDSRRHRRSGAPQAACRAARDRGRRARRARAAAVARPCAPAHGVARASPHAEAAASIRTCRGSIRCAVLTASCTPSPPCSTTTRSSRPTSASTRCGSRRRIRCAARASGSPLAASARWASACLPRSAPRSLTRSARSCASRATARYS